MHRIAPLLAGMLLITLSVILTYILPDTHSEFTSVREWVVAGLSLCLSSSGAMLVGWNGMAMLTGNFYTND